MEERKDVARPFPPVEHDDNGSQVYLTGEKSPGVARIEALAAHLTTFDRVFLYIGVFIIAYSYSLDGTIRYTYQVSI